MDFLNNISIKKKLLLTYIIIVTFPIIIIGYFLTNKLENASLSSTIQFTNASLNQLDRNFMGRLDIYKGIIDSLLKDTIFIQYIFTKFDDDYESYSYFKEKIDPYLNRLIFNDTSILLKVYTNNMTIGFSGTTNNSMQDLLQEKWYIDSITHNRLSGWAKLGRLPGRDGKYLCYYKEIPDYNTQKINVAVAVSFKEKELYSLISEEGKSGKVIYLLDNYGNILTSTDRQAIEGTIDNISINVDNNINPVKNYSVINYKGSRYFYFTKEVNNEPLFIKDWKIIYMIPTGQIQSYSRTIWITSFVIIIISILISFGIILLISTNITRRISSLIWTIEKVKERNFKAMVDVSGKDEIGTLEGDFNHMVNTIDRLIKEIYESEIRNQRIQNEKKEAEINALQGQINPHYLFNTLETIRLNLVIKGDRKTANIVKLFADSFRNCLESGKEMVTIAEELRFVENFFLIQVYRFGSKINLVVNIQKELLEVLIPKLLIQPVVENAAYHGLEPKDGDGNIWITAEKKGKTLCIYISDDGVGIDDENMERLKQSIYSNAETNKTRSGTGMALRNVHNRLQLIYGEEYRLTIKSRKNAGTIVELNLPIETGMNFGEMQDVQSFDS
ncbi:MAG: hypothetical protein A2Y21_04160 [Clostridiales bacterium GWC2_40_7]|nr:MAG: hypothetical protein A2Y21_04160 [Clostridiales bacterium GWC2_40_7]